MKAEFQTEIVDGLELYTIVLIPESQKDFQILDKWEGINYYTDVYQDKEQKRYIDIQ